jgi:hypothetical protein
VAIKVASVAAEFEVTGLDKVKAAFQEVEGHAQSHSATIANHYGKATRHLTLVANEAVRAGDIGGTALQKILIIGGDMAGMFGATGAVVGAFAVAGLAIYNYYDRAQKKIEEMANSVRAELRSIRDMSGKDAAAVINRAVEGDPLALTKDNKIDRYGELSKNALEETQQRLRKGQDIGVDVRTEKEKEYGITLEGVNDTLKQRIELIAKATPLLVATTTREGKATIAEGRAGLAAKEKAEVAAREAALSKRIEILTKGLVFDDQRKRVTSELAVLEKQLTATVKSGTLSLEERSQALLHLSDVQDALAKKFITPAAVTDVSQLVKATPNSDTPAARAYETFGKAMDLVKERATPELDEYKKQIIDWAKPMEAILKELGADLRHKIAATLGTAIYDGFSAAFSGKGLSGVFKAFSKTVLSGIGGIFTQQGAIYLEYAAVLAGFTPHLFNPVTSAWAAAGIGVALVAMGAALGALGTGGSHGASGASIPRPAEITNIKLTPTSVADQARYDPNRQINNFNIIGTNDPKAQRELADMVEKGSRR